MSWVSIDQDKCNNCGICALRCMRCFSNTDGEITAHADEDCCNLCGHCIALCPTDAITHSQMDMSNFTEVNDQISYDTDEFIQLIRQRRSHRSFKDREIPRNDLEKLVDMCRYTPTGSNLQTVQIKVISNKEKIKKLSDLTIDYFMEMINKIESQVKQLSLEKKEIPKELREMHDFANRYRMLGLARDIGMDPILHQAPAVMLFHSPSSSSTPKDDCVIAAQTVVLTAMTMGLGTCYIGLLNFSANSYAPVKEELNLPSGNKVGSILVLGYPKLKFLLTVDRKPIQVEWEV